MKNYLLKPFLFVILIWFITMQANAQLPVFNSVTANTGTPMKFDKFELNINLTAAYTNAYDYSDIDVRCIFFAPSGRKSSSFIAEPFIVSNKFSTL